MAVLLLLVALPGAGYVIGYLILSDRSTVDLTGLVVETDLGNTAVVCTFPRPWQVDLYEPAAELESLLTGQPVVVVASEPEGSYELRPLE